jgi:hypothetical protein
MPFRSHFMNGIYGAGPRGVAGYIVSRGVSWTNAWEAKWPFELTMAACLLA